MNISFVIITNGKNNDKLNLQIRSIINQNIPNYQIIVSGDIPSTMIDYPNIDTFSDIDGARYGKLGQLRNNACNCAKYEYIVVSDDDMLFTKDWYENLLKVPFNCDIMTPCVKLPDGTRFWDHCCYMSPVRGHIILNPGEYDKYLYMSGGQSWIMKKEVFEKVKWTEDLLIYNMKNLNDYRSGKHNEDTDFALKCRENGMYIKHNHFMTVYHNDDTYTSVGRMVFRRRDKGSNWCKDIIYSETDLNLVIDELSKQGVTAERIDILRKYGDNRILNDVENQLGGKLYNSNFTYDNKEYISLL